MKQSLSISRFNRDCLITSKQIRHIKTSCSNCALILSIPYKISGDIGWGVGGKKIIFICPDCNITLSLRYTSEEYIYVYYDKIRKG
jgi:hypothetical protein